MKLLEKLRAQPAWQSDDPVVRLDAVRTLPDDDQADGVLLEVARQDADRRVRHAAVERMTDLAGLVSLVRAPDLDAETRRAAGDGVRDMVAQATDVASVVEALGALSDERDLGAVARTAEVEAVAVAALERVMNDKTLGAVARKARHVVVALDAVSRLQDRAELASVAIKTDDKAVALAAYERLTAAAVAAETLDDIARRAKQKSVARRARETVEARRAQTVASAAAVDEETAMARSLCDTLERLAVSVVALDDGRRAFDAAVERWSQLEGPLGPAEVDRFAAGRRAVEDRLLALDAASAEVQRVTEQRTAAESPREALCRQVERLDGADALETLQQRRDEWAALAPPADPDPETAASLTALAARFEAAAAACETRHASFLASRAEVASQVAALEPLVARLEQLVATGDPETVRTGWSGLDTQWRRAVAGLGDRETDDETLLALRDRKQAVDERRRAVVADGQDARDETARRNLLRLQKLAASIDTAVKNDALPLRDAERQLRQVRQALDSPLPLPTRRDHDAIMRILRDGSTALLGRVRELRDFADWQRWANLGIQEDLCRRMEALAAPPDGGPALSDEELVRTFRELMNGWREAADAPRGKGQALWQRFKTAHDVVSPRCETYLVAQRRERGKNRERRLAMVEEAERLRDSTEWIKTAARLTALQAEWKAVGPVSRKDHRELWDRFRAACGAFFTRRKADLADRKRQWADNLKQKEALCERVKALQESDDVPAAIAEVKRRQAEWKKVGPVRRQKSDAIWAEFRAACDAVFDRVTAGERRAAAERIAAREALCVELESLPPETDGLTDRVREMQRQWRQAPDVPPDVRRRLSARFGQAIARLAESQPDAFRGTSLDPARKLKQLRTLCARAEALVPTEALGEAGASPAEILAKKWREQLASNTIGGRVDEPAKRRAAIEEVKRLQAEHRHLGPVSGPDASTLHARFQRACDRAYQKNKAKAAS